MDAEVIERKPLPDSGKRSEFETGSVRDACEGKGIPSLIPVSALRSVAKRFEDGATKYGRDNWKKGQAITELLGSLFRHIIAFQNGEDLDEESGKSHIGHAMCNLLFIQYVLDNHKHFDDRKKGA